MSRTHRSTSSWLTASITALLVAGIAGTVFAAPDGDDDEVLEELRRLRQRVEELEAWKASRQAEDAVGEAALEAAVRAYVEAAAEADGGANRPGLVYSPRSRRIDLGGQLRVRAEKNLRSYTLADVDGRSSNGFWLNRARLHADVDVNDKVRAYVEFQDARVWGSEPSTAANTANTDLSQGYVDVREVAGLPMDMRAGRQATALSDQRFVGALEWANNGRRFDGVTFMHRHEGMKTVGFAYRLAEGFIEPAATPGGEVAGGDNDVNFYGVWWFMDDVIPSSTTEVFGLWLDSGQPRASEPTVVGGSSMSRGDTTFGTYGTRIHGKDDGGLDWDFQAAAQRGELAGDALKAWAARGEVGYTFEGIDWKPRFFVEYDFATGEKRLEDGKRRQFQVLFPTNHGYYGIADYQAWSNMRAWSAGFTLKPSASTHLKVQFWDFRLDRSAGGWVLASGATLRPGTNTGPSRDLGEEIDVILSIKETENSSWQIGWAHFMPGQFVKRSQSGEGSAIDADFAYIQYLLKF